jgi:hypothetical protein
MPPNTGQAEPSIHENWNRELDIVEKAVVPAIEACRAAGVSLPALHYGLYRENQKLVKEMTEDEGLRRTSSDLFGGPNGWA